MHQILWQTEDFVFKQLVEININLRTTGNNIIEGFFDD